MEEKTHLHPARFSKRNSFRANGITLWCFISFFLFSLPVFARTIDPEYDELLVFFHVDLIGSTEMPAVIRGREIYLPVVEVFNFLGIKTNTQDGLSHISGFIAGAEDSYAIDGDNMRIEYRENTFPLNPEGVIRTETNLYLRSDYFGKVFGLECNFNFRQLSVSLRSTTELPAVRSARLEKMRSNISRLKREFMPDTIIGRKKTLFQLGTVDWAVNSRQQTGGSPSTWFNLAVGANLAGGELKGQLNYMDNSPFLASSQYYLWRYVNNDRRLFRQVMAGKIPARPVSTIFRPIVGVQVSNTPTARKTSFGTYSLQDYTQPGWIVELYMNNTLVDYVKADASGFFTLDVPLIYGSSQVTLRYYGPWGEAHTSQRNFNIPYAFLPPNQLEYTVSAGMVEDGTNSIFSQTRVNYGLFRNVTVGGGLEYLSSISAGKYMPFFNTSIRIGSNVFLTGEYVNGVRSNGKLSYFSPSRLRFELTHTRYEQAQEAVLYNYTKETEAIVGMPFRLFNATFFSRLTLSRNYLNAVQFNNARLELSGSANGVSVNLKTFAREMSERDPHVYSEVTTSFMLPAKFILDGRARYEHNQTTFTYLQLGLKKNLFNKGVVNASYERDLSNDLNYFRIGLIYNFSFASLSFSSNHSRNGTSFFESASGSLSHEPKTNYVNLNRRRNTGTGGIIISPFLDLNANQRRDKDEPGVSGLHIQGSGGHIEKDTEDNTIVITGLEAYTNYFLELDGTGFDNIAWRIDKPALSIMIEPSQLRLIEIPVTVAGEASGMSYLQENDAQKGIGRIKVNFYDHQSRLVASTLSEPDGYFSYLGLSPGRYLAKIDPEQLDNLNMSSVPGERSFFIVGTEEGDFVDHLKFVLRENASTETDLPAIEKKLSAPEGIYTPQPDSGVVYKVQLMATRENISLQNPIFHGLEDVQMHYHESMYKYTWGTVRSVDHAEILVNELEEKGFKGAFVVPFNQNKRSDHPEETTKAGDTDLPKHLVFKVQLLASRRKLSLDHMKFKGLDGIKMYYHNHMYKYTWGEVRSVEDAMILKNELKNMEFSGAFIVPFYKNERILFNNAMVIDRTSTTGLFFRVRVMASRKLLPFSHPLLKDLKGIEVYSANGLYNYTWGETSSYKEATKIQKELMQLGFSSTQIVPFYQK